MVEKEKKPQNDETKWGRCKGCDDKFKKLKI